MTTSPTSTVAPPSILGSRRSALAVTLMFAVNGLLLGGWGGVIPSVRDRLDLDPIQIAGMLLAGGICAIASMQVGGRLADAVGARGVALAGLPVIMLGCLLIGLADQYWLAVAGGALTGLGNGAMDVAMNALGVQVEKARRRPIMSFFHAFFSVGNLVGAGSVLVLGRALDRDAAQVVLPVMLTLVGIAAVGLVWLIMIAPQAEKVDHVVDGRRVRVPVAAYVLGIMALCFGLSEGTAIDWSSIHVVDVTDVSPTTGALGLVAVSGFMTVIRLLGDRLVTRFGRRAVVRFGGACACVGYLTTVLAQPLPLVVVGWSLVGFGVGMIAPQVYAVAGHMGGGRVLAVVVTFGYSAFLIGPAVMGLTVHRLGVQHAMVLPTVLCALIVLLAVTMPAEDQDLQE